MSWLSGDYATDLPSKAEQAAIAPPDLDVKREILRLELEAEVANLQAEADALRAEAAAEGRSVEAIDAALAAASAGETTTDAESVDEPVTTADAADAPETTATPDSEEPAETRDSTAG